MSGVTTSPPACSGSTDRAWLTVSGGMGGVRAVGFGAMLLVFVYDCYMRCSGSKIFFRD